jgi:polynucleotide 5'-hydroxyl-kinase GRC3/NOL9
MPASIPQTMVADNLIAPGRTHKGLWLFLGATDTGKTTLIETLASRLASDHTVAIVDADVGQSHIGPPTTVGWARVKPGQSDLSRIESEGLAFVGDVTPVGHLLQLTTAIALCTRAASKIAEIVLIDTPGYVTDSAACALWWNVERLLQPSCLVAIRRASELDTLLRGLGNVSSLGVVDASQGIPSKSPEQRRLHRQRLFEQYFRSTRIHEIPLDTMALRTAGPASLVSPVGHLAALGGDHGMDLAIGIVESYQPARRLLSVRSPLSDILAVRCITLGSLWTDAASSIAGW